MLHIRDRVITYRHGLTNKMIRGCGVVGGMSVCMEQACSLSSSSQRSYSSLVLSRVKGNSDVSVTHRGRQWMEKKHTIRRCMSSDGGDESSNTPTTRRSVRRRKIKKLLVANRGEIAIRIMRSAHEMGIETVSVYTKEDSGQLFRQKATEAYMIGEGLGAVEAYLNISEIVSVAKRTGCDAVHPGYGLLSERADFAKACEDADIAFIGPASTIVNQMGNKTEARALAIATGVSVVPGIEKPISDYEHVEEFCEKFGFPVMLKAAFGGGGRGMRIVRSMDELKEGFELATSEAKAAFGNGSMFVERYVENPRHIEVQILGDQHGNLVHLFERDCSVQRRYQKVVEIAPCPGISDDLRTRLTSDALKLGRQCGYYNAGTVEFLVDSEDRHYFIEVNARLQVEHTVTEEVTGVDLVHSQIRIAEGASLRQLGLTQSKIKLNGYAIQCRVTTEDATKDFRPSTGVIDQYLAAEGMGIRLDVGSGFSGAEITPFYDSLLAKVTGRATTFAGASRKLVRALDEMRISGVTTNVGFLCNVLSHPDFLRGGVDTSFIPEHPEVLTPTKAKPRVVKERKLLNYIASLVVNGPMTTVGTTTPPSAEVAKVRDVPDVSPPKGWRDIYVKKGPAEFAKAVRKHRRTLITDTTWRDAHQSLLATRVRTHDLKRIAPLTSHYLSNAFSLEMWGGATFDVALRFLRECPWDRLEELRELVPNIPFQMLLRGANGVGYTGYPDNAVFKFCEQSVKSGMDVFRVFDSLNYMPNMQLGIEAVGAAGGIVEAAISYSGDVSDPKRTKYTLDYYLNLARQFVDAGAHILCIKDMAGLLKPQAATMLVKALRREFPTVPIHVHTHDTSGAGVAAMVRAAEAGADVVDLAVDSMSGMTSQPSMGAVLASLQNTPKEVAVDLRHVSELSNYWEVTRGAYGPFECTSTMKTGSADVYVHEIPGGQYTNLHFQAFSLGLSHQWPTIKQKYAEANMLLGDIVKVTPSSKVCGDMAQFMVQNKLSMDDVKQQAKTLDFPSSVIEFFQGYLGQPHGGFPEPLRTDIIRDLPRVDTRPGEQLEPIDFDAVKSQLEVKHPTLHIRDADVMSSVMYPQVFDEYARFKEEFGDVDSLPTRFYFVAPELEEEVNLELERGHHVTLKVVSVGELRSHGHRDVHFLINGRPRVVSVKDAAAAKGMAQREKADDAADGSVGAPMPGKVVKIAVEKGDSVAVGDKLAVLSAMKMETAITSSVSGKVSRIAVKVGEELEGGDLVMEIDEEE